MDIANVTLPNYNLTETESGEFELNITSLTPEETLAGSKLLEIDVNKTSKLEIRREFCREIKAVSLKYSEPQVSLFKMHESIGNVLKLIEKFLAL